MSEPCGAAKAIFHISPLVRIPVALASVRGTAYLLTSASTPARTRAYRGSSIAGRAENRNPLTSRSWWTHLRVIANVEWSMESLVSVAELHEQRVGASHAITLIVPANDV